MRSFLYRWRTSISIALAVLVFVATVSVVLNRIGDTASENKDTIAALVEERITSRVGECNNAAEFRREFPSTLRDLGEAAVATGGIDLTALPEFEALPVSMKNYLEALSAALSAQPGSDSLLDKVADDFERKFPAPDCVALEKKLRRELRPA